MKAVRKIIKVLAILLVVAFIGIQFKHASLTNPGFSAADSLQANVHMNEQVEGILNKACADCHSNQTHWPWYSNIAPVSWYVVDHVNHGRKHLNFSEWTKKSPHSPNATAQNHLQAICTEAQNGSMPLSSYTVIHRSAKLTDDEINTLCDWALAEKERLAQNEQSGATMPLIK